jgi:hypothetical protein
MNELMPLVADASESGFAVRALGYSIFTEADTMEELRSNMREAVHCHFDEGQIPPNLSAIEVGTLAAFW